MGKLPAIQFYPGDWRKDSGIQSLSYHEKGVWMEILFFMHESGVRGKLLLNGKCISEDRLSRLLHLDKQETNSLINTFLELGVADTCPVTGALMNRRMVRDEAIRQQKAEAGRAGGGNPNFSKGSKNPYIKSNKQDDKQDDKQKGGSSSSSSVSSSSSKQEQDDSLWKIEKEQAFEKAWNSYPGIKDGKKASRGHWNASIKKHSDLHIYHSAICAYRESIRLERLGGFPNLNYKHAKTWFNNWQDYIPVEDPEVIEEPDQSTLQPKERPKIEPELEKLWNDSLEKIRADIKPDAFELWFKFTYPKTFENGKLTIAVPNQFTRKSLIENYRGLIERTLRSTRGSLVLVDFCIET